MRVVFVSGLLVRGHDLRILDVRDSRHYAPLLRLRKVEHVTVMSIISADGTAAKPVVVYSGSSAVLD